MLGIIPDTSKDIDLSDLKPYIYEEQLAAKEREKKESQIHAID